MKACMESAADGAARTSCRDTTAKAALATALGKQTSDITATELNQFMADAGKDQVREEMKACMQSAADGAARTTCKDTTAKAALATALGKEASEITPTELNKFMADAGKDQVRVEMKACMESASDGAARTACKDTTAKAALATSLGKEASDISASELNRFVNNAAKDQVREEMKACMGNAADGAARTACKATTAKAALATSLGKQTSDITPTELNKFVNDAA
jgi:hypothetical protein